MLDLQAQAQQLQKIFVLFVIGLACRLRLGSVGKLAEADHAAWLRG